MWSPLGCLRWQSMKSRAALTRVMRLTKTSVTSVRQSGVPRIVGSMVLAPEKRTSFPLDVFLGGRCALSDSLIGHSDGRLRPVHPRPPTPYSLPSGMISAAEK